ncbi:alpha/beta hydrolase family protein, partial [Klebsiella pneumoniae]|uniref:alpha/beta hydrolase family protein n=1 Tax=Klebsiella pneumoniae TaxID=573 RepID=UPI0027318AA2
ARRPLLWPLLPLLRSPLDSRAAARRLQTRLLVLLAERDSQVPLQHSLDLVQALRDAGSRVSVQRLPRTNHRNLARRPEAM